MPLVEQISEQKAKANVDYLYYSDNERENDESDIYAAADGGYRGAAEQSGAGEAVGSAAHNRSQSMNNLLFTSADRKAIKSYARWNQTNCQAKQIAVRMLSRLAQNKTIKPKVTAFKSSILK